MSSGEKMGQNVGEGQVGKSGGEIGKRVIEILSEKSIDAEFDKQLEDSKRIRDAFSNINGTRNFLSYGPRFADFGEEGFSGEDALLFMLVQFQKENGPKTELVQIGWGEFSKQTFTKGDKSNYSDYAPEYKNGKDYGYVASHEVLRSLPFDVYCVRKVDRWFVSEKTKNDMCFHPEKYLQEHALFVANNGSVTMALKRDPEDIMKKRNRIFKYGIVPITEEEALESINRMQVLYRETIEKLSREAQ